MKNNLHFFISDLTVETRLFKESEYCFNNNIANSYALGKGDYILPNSEINNSNLNIYRCNFIKINMFKNRFFKLLALMTNLIKYSFFAFFYTIKLNVDNIVIHNCGLLPLGKIISILTKKKLIYQPHELESKKSGNSFLLNEISFYIEKFCLNKRSTVITVCEPISKWYKAKYNFDNVYTIRNVPNTSQLTNENINQSPYCSMQFFSENNIKFIYLGLISANRGCNTIIESCEKQRKNLVLMGHVDSTVKKSDYNYIKFKEPVEKDNIIGITSFADVGIHINNDNSLSYTYSLPNKFFEYMHSGIPIIVSSNMTYLSSIVVKHRLGWVIDYENFESFISNLLPDDIKNMKRFISDYAKNCTYENDAEILMGIY